MGKTTRRLLEDIEIHMIWYVKFIFFSPKSLVNLCLLHLNWLYSSKWSSMLYEILLRNYQYLCTSYRWQLASNGTKQQLWLVRSRLSYASFQKLKVMGMLNQCSSLVVNGSLKKINVVLTWHCMPFMVNSFG